MVDRKDVASWLEGPRARAPRPAGAHPGSRLGLPAHGTGSVGRFGRRLVGAFIDWMLCQSIAVAFFGMHLGEGGPWSFVPLAIFAVENVVLVSTLGFTIGHRVVGLQVRSLDGGAARPVQVLVRTVLLCLFLPAMFWDTDGRGLHDRTAGTVIVRL